MKSNRFIKRLDWYIIKKFLGTYVFAIALIISIAVVFDFNEKMDKLMEHEAPWDKIIFEYYMNFIPYFSNLFSPLFVFIAVIFFLIKFQILIVTDIRIVNHLYTSHYQTDTVT